ncbi:hypothetical protein A2T98_10030 [Nodularia spumigena CENA596]|uniref:Polymerase nucleotidyl transferase domain-containing protein n=1 Tax=Nodularia spumigena CENA596 TaxID=1819295 RepID=A0A166JN61_NODSP|nr:hypothetical protein [Nodularia spumigena]KZL49918.1 hypothetical protein A2T98_10030 [Nodularia spumigena CENA596]
MSEANYLAAENNYPTTFEVPTFAQTIAAEFSSLPQVLAVVLAGSQTALVADKLSDLDFYVYIMGFINYALNYQKNQSYHSKVTKFVIMHSYSEHL